MTNVKKDTLKSSKLDIRVSLDEKITFATAARISGKNVSNWVRDVLLERASELQNRGDAKNPQT